MKNEFTELLKEAFTADEPFETDSRREAILEAVAGYDRRMRLVRGMTWSMVTAFTVIFVWMIVLLWSAPAEAPTNRQLFYLAMLVVSIQGGWVGKTWYYNMHNHARTMREIKRTQLFVLDIGARDAADPR